MQIIALRMIYKGHVHKILARVKICTDSKLQ